VGGAVAHLTPLRRQTQSGGKSGVEMTQTQDALARAMNPHLGHGEPIRKTLTDGSHVWDCPCGYGYENEREATTGFAYADWQKGARIVTKPWESQREARLGRRLRKVGLK
jgi:hypothetical protein